MDAAISPAAANASAVAAPPRAKGRHRGEHRDPIGTVLTGLWAAGHLVTISLLGAVTHDHLTGHHAFHAVAEDTSAWASDARPD
ncbi:hypothetical protein [Kitasatospora sp. NPDC094011]|uniref:hypothetical protein n=1 Tax=Kitasatospora sp. NPDC094011 TaxID=3364090 RepID=UPI00382D5EEF